MMGQCKPVELDEWIEENEGAELSFSCFCKVSLSYTYTEVRHTDPGRLPWQNHLWNIAGACLRLKD